MMSTTRAAYKPSQKMNGTAGGEYVSALESLTAKLCFSFNILLILRSKRFYVWGYVGIHEVRILVFDNLLKASSALE